MKFRPGDRVKFMDEAGGGIVTRIDAHGLVHVETEDGFEIPVPPEKLLRTEMDPSVSMAEENTLPERETEITSSGSPTERTEILFREEQGISDKDLPVLEDITDIYLALIPEASSYTCLLVNDSPYQLFYIFGFTDLHTSTVVSQGVLEEDTKIELGAIAPEVERTLFLQALITADRRYPAHPPLDKQIPFAPEQIIADLRLAENPYTDEEAWLIGLIPEKKNLEPTGGTVKEEESEKKEKPEKKLMFRPRISGHEPIEEIDLHIEAITDNFAQLSQGEILEMQLARFETALEGAKKSGQKKIIFIHGLGQGKLKFRIRNILEQQKIRYQDASFKEYGYGATLVILK